MPGKFKELGSSGLSQWGRLLYIDPDPRFRWPAGARVYDEIRHTDPTGIAMHQILTLPILKVQWRVVPGGRKTRGDQTAAEFVWDCLSTMPDMSFPDLLDDICTMFTYGWAWFEMVMRRRSDGTVGFGEIAFRPQHSWYQWVIDDETGKLTAMEQYTLKGSNAIIPVERSLHFRTCRDGNIPEGLSIYRAAARAYQFKRRLEQIEGMGLYRRWAGFPVVTLPNGATTIEEEGQKSDEQKAKDLVEQIYNDEVMGAHLPSGWSIDLGGPQGTVDDTLGATIMRKDLEMARSILAQFMLVGLRETGTQSLAGTLMEAYWLAIEAYLNSIMSVFNRKAIPYLMRWNSMRGVTGMPVLTCSSPRALDLGAIGQFIGSLSGAGAFTPDRDAEVFLRSLIPGMPTEVAEGVEDDEPKPAGRPGTGKPALSDGKDGEAEEKDPPQGGEEDGERDGEDPAAGEEVEPEEDAQEAMLGGTETFAVVPAAERQQRYTAAADANAQTQRANLENWAGDAADAIAGLGPETTEADLRSKIDDWTLVGMLLFRERSVIDIAAAFWLAFGKPAGGSEENAALSRETDMADSYIGYDGPDRIRRVNPDGGGTLFGDIAGTLEGRIAAILLLLKAGRRQEAGAEFIAAVKEATNSYARGGLYAGHVWHSIWAGAGQRMTPVERATVPVRWVMDNLAKHCSECPRYAREYASWNQMIAFTQGTLPGHGTPCDGNCRCDLQKYEGGRWVWL